PESLAEVRADLFEHFGGSTIDGVVDGEYRMDDGQKRSEKLLKIWVPVEKDEQVTLVKKLAKKYCKLFKQESICFELTDAKVEFIRAEAKGVDNE
ncbi:MAG: hypothetical protein Q8L55_03250, partial [Phycisphaerales bacterium]|nr:hypothetical protein [Phycisphaerales bacterium]